MKTKDTDDGDILYCEKVIFPHVDFEQQVKIGDILKAKKLWTIEYNIMPVSQDKYTTMFWWCEMHPGEHVLITDISLKRRQFLHRYKIDCLSSSRKGVISASLDALSEHFVIISTHENHA